MATDRLALTRQDHVRYQLKIPYRDGTTHIILKPLDFIAHLAALTPKPRVNLTRFHGVDKSEVVGLTKVPVELVAPPRVAESLVNLERRLVKIVELLADEPDSPNPVTFEHVVGIHISDEIIVDGRVDIHRLQPISRLGYADYGRVTEVFSMQRGGWPIE